MQPTDLLTQTEVAALLGVSKQLVGKWVKDKRIKSVTIAGRPLIERRHAKKPAALKSGPKAG